jgi:hypothetical protein
MRNRTWRLSEPVSFWSRTLFLKSENELLWIFDESWRQFRIFTLQVSGKKIINLSQNLGSLDNLDYLKKNFFFVSFAGNFCSRATVSSDLFALKWQSKLWALLCQIRFFQKNIFNSWCKRLTSLHVVWFYLIWKLTSWLVLLYTI